MIKIKDFLSSTSIDNIFFDKYMISANGLYVQIYLLCIRRLNANLKVNNTIISETLDIPSSDVLRAWTYWEKQGVIEFEDEDRTINSNIKLIDLKTKELKDLYGLDMDTNLFLINNKAEIEETESKNENDNNLRPTQNPNLLIEAKRMPYVNEMFERINKAISRRLEVNEQLRVLDILYDYNIDPPLISRAYEHASSKSKPLRVDFIKGIIMNWKNDNIISEEDLDKKLLAEDEKYIYYNKVFKSLGFNRMPTEKEREIMDSWVSNMKFSHEMVLLASSLTCNIAEPSIKYLDGILKNWLRDNIKTIEDYNNHKKMWEDKKEKKSKQNVNEIRKKENNPFKTKFHLNNSRVSKYTAKELEDIMFNRKKNK